MKITLFLSLFFFSITNVYSDECISGNCTDGFGTYVWDNGDRYVGESVNNLGHGLGTYYYSNGNQYTGEWINNLTHGNGTFTWSDGTQKSGIWKNGKLQE